MSAYRVGSRLCPARNWTVCPTSWANLSVFRSLRVRRSIYENSLVPRSRGLAQDHIVAGSPRLVRGQVAVNGKLHQPGDVVNIELAHQAGPVRIHSLGAQFKPRSDLF